MNQKTKCRFGIHDWNKWKYDTSVVTRTYLYGGKKEEIARVFGSRICKECGQECVRLEREYTLKVTNPDD